MTAAAADLSLLLVDDNEELLRGLTRQLTPLGCAVQTASNGEQALEALQQKQFDAMVLDLRMEGMDGWEVLRRTQTLSPKPVIVVMSGYLDVNQTARAMREGASDAIQKPASPSEVYQRIRERLKTESRSQEAAGPDLPRQRMPLRDLERSIIIETYQANGENVSQTARELGMPRSTLRDKLRRYGLR